MNGLDLFSGIGGLGLALSPWVHPIAYCENDRYAQAVLLSRMQDGQLPMAPIWPDVRTLQGKSMAGFIDIIYGGFPCQDISVAGRGDGLGGERSGLFSEIMRLAQEIKPQFIFLENVPAIRTRGLNHVAEWLAFAGYDCRWDIVSAAEVGAIHIRKRWFLLANTNGKRLREKQRPKFQRPREIEGPMEPHGQGSPRETSGPSFGSFKPYVDRAADGLQFNVDRNKCLGNAVVPQQAREAFKRLCGIK